MRMKFTTHDLTRGHPMKLILGFTIPQVFGLLFQQLYNLADTMIVGQTLGTDALASVGATGSFNFLIVGFCIGLCSGFVIPVAQQFGAGDRAAMRRFVANGAWLSVFFAIGMTAAMLVFCRSILTAMRTPENIFENSYAYISVIFLGIPVTFLYNLTAGFIRSLGDSNTPVLILTAAAILNVGLDLLFILVMHWGVAGAAWATIISQALSGLACLWFIVRRLPVLHLQKGEWRPDKTAIRLLCGMGLPMGLQYSITAIGAVVLQSAVNGLGSLAVAAVATAGKIYSFFTCFYDAIGSTMATYSGQNIGARKPDRVRQGLRCALLLCVVYSVFAFAAILLFGRSLPRLFVSENDPQLFALVYRFLVYNAAFFFPLAVVIAVRFLIQGLGYSKLAIIAGVCEMAARTAASFLLVPHFGFDAVALASPLAWIAADVFLVIAYRRIMRNLQSELPPPEIQES